jgi:hypothetical protein
VPHGKGAWDGLVGDPGSDGHPDIQKAEKEIKQQSKSEHIHRNSDVSQSY